jgi:hypothetical protein
MMTPAEQVEALHNVKEAEAMEKADPITKAVVEPPKGNVRVDCSENEKMGITCPQCKSFKVATWGHIKGYDKVAPMQKHQPAYCGECGWNVIGKPFVKRGGTCDRNDPCPCGSGKKHKKCCLPLMQLRKTHLMHKGLRRVTCKDCKNLVGKMCIVKVEDRTINDVVCEKFELNVVKKGV